ncbi:MAG: LptF/LptG family permease [Planctomycetota bacterium]
MIRVAGLRAFGTLDRYVLRLFLASYATAFFLVVGLLLILDLASNLDGYLAPDEGERAASGLEILHFYALQVPFLFLGVSPFVTLIAGLFTGARLSRSREIVAVLDAGVSARRTFGMVLLAGTCAAVGMFALREWVGERLSFERNLAQDRVAEHRERPVWQTFWVPDVEGRSWRIGSYRPGYDDVPPTIEHLVGRYRGAEGVVEVRAERATWSKGEWRLAGGLRRSSSGHEQREEAIERSGEFSVTPSDLLLAIQERDNALDLSYRQATYLLTREPDSTSLETVRQYHLTFPIAGLVLLLVGLPFVALPKRGGGLERIGVGFLLCMGYFVVDFIFRTLGMQGQIDALYAAWVPLIVFGSLGLVLFGGMRT